MATSNTTLFTAAAATQASEVSTASKAAAAEAQAAYSAELGYGGINQYTGRTIVTPTSTNPFPGGAESKQSKASAHAALFTTPVAAAEAATAEVAAAAEANTAPITSPASSKYMNVTKDLYKTSYSWGTEDFIKSGQPTTPGVTRGALTATGISFTNNRLSHACDFKFNLSPNISLTAIVPNLGILTGAIKNGKNAAAAMIRAAMTRLNQIFRLAIDGILASLNLDITGVFSAEFSYLKK